MEPKIKNGSFFISSSLPYLFVSPKKNEIIIFENQKKIIVKRIEKISGELFYISGFNKMDDKKFAPITKKKILGKVIWIF